MPEYHEYRQKIMRSPSTLMNFLAGHFWERRIKLRRLKPGLTHDLASELIVSLTSYPPRFGKLSLTIKCLLSQTIKPDMVILWVSDSDFELLPNNVLALQKNGLIIKKCEDLKSFKKLIPALELYPEAAIVTCDDDTYYWPTWLQELVSHYCLKAKQIVCHRAHEIKFDKHDRPLAYKYWKQNLAGECSGQYIFPTGVGGVLYPPGIFPPMVKDWAVFMSLCPQGDDLWFFWMAARNGATFKKVKSSRNFVSWPRSQQIGLHRSNTMGTNGNDIQIAALNSKFPLVLS